MSIPEDVVEQYLQFLMMHSGPEQVLHHLLVAASEPAGGALGLPDPATLRVSLYAIAPQGPGADRLIDRAIVRAGTDAVRQGKVVQFAGLAMQTDAVVTYDERVREQALELLAGRRLQEHPDAVSTVWVYAASRDGRRWSGRRFLDGPRAGQTWGPDLLAGGLAAHERGAHERLIRATVGVRLV